MCNLSAQFIGNASRSFGGQQYQQHTQQFTVDATQLLLLKNKPTTLHDADDWTWVTARRQRKKKKVLAGFARATGDRALTASIHDVVVLPELQGLGLGRKLLAKATNQVTDLLLLFCLSLLFCVFTKHKEGHQPGNKFNCHCLFVTVLSFQHKQKATDQVPDWVVTVLFITILLSFVKPYKRLSFACSLLLAHVLLQLGSPLQICAWQAESLMSVMPYICKFINALVPFHIRHLWYV